MVILTLNVNNNKCDWLINNLSYYFEKYYLGPNNILMRTVESGILVSQCNLLENYFLARIYGTTCSGIDP